MVQLEYKNEINPIAILLNTCCLIGAVNGFIIEIQAKEMGGFLLLFILTFLLTANLIRLTKKKIKIELYGRYFVFKSMFGWNKVISFEDPTEEFFYIKEENRNPLNKTQLDSINYFKNHFFDGIKALFNLKRNSNLYYKDRLIYKGVVGEIN